MSSQRVEELEKRIRLLEDELARLRHSAGFTIAAGAPAGLPGTIAQSGSVVGIEEMIATVDREGRIAFLNGPMAVFLGVEDRKEASGQPLAALDRTALGAGFIGGIVDGARGAREPWVIERECPDLDPKLLPGPRGRARPQTAPVLRIVATAKGGSVTLVMQDVTEIKWLERNFARCVSPEVLVRMYQTPEGDFLKPERREISVLFADLRGFTRMSNAISPEEVHLAINSFLAEMVAAVEKFGGTVDKFVGDEVMALFGAPLPQQDHALRALLCAVEMQARHARWAEARSAADKPGLGLGVGVATGPVVVGNVGTPQRLEYTALGHTVNLGARLCGDAAAGEILTTARTYEATRAVIKGRLTDLADIPHLRFESAGMRQFKNVLEPVEVIRAWRA
jgi:class 3 adenylate cyclase